jgi:hypothetical protein
MQEAVMGAGVVTVNDVLNGHVALDIQCLDRIYLNAYVPNLQTSAQVVAFLSTHLGYRFPSPALFNQIGQRFRRAVAAYAEANDLPWVQFGKGDDKLAVLRAHLDRQAATGGSGVAAIGVAQEFQRVWTATQGKTATGTSRWSFYKADRRVTCYYFYLWDADFGAAFIKVCAWFPYPAKVWLNGHEWAKRQATKAGIGFTELSNGFAACDDAAALQAVCDRLGPGTIHVFVERWLARLPCRSPTPTVTLATGGKPPCARSRSPAPSSSTRPDMPAASSKPSSSTTSTSAGPTTSRSSSADGSAATPSAPSAPPSTAATTVACSSTSSTATPASSNTSKTAARCASRPSSTPPRPGRQRPPTQSRRPAGQGPCLQPADPAS